MIFEVSPMDKYNQTLIENVHPPDWINPEPTAKYHLVVIGAGTAGLITAAAGAGLGGRVALIERHLMGGDCLNVGCVPSKAVIRSARVRSDFMRVNEFGWEACGDLNVQFPKVMERMRRIRSGISHHDSATRYRSLGVDVFMGEASFLNGTTIEVGDKRLNFSKAVICTGARAVRPPIPGLEATGYLTNETVFNLTERPDRLAVIGGGPIGCELAQSFRRFGSDVTILQKTTHFLKQEDEDAAAILEDRFRREGLILALNANTSKVEKTDDGKVLHYEISGESKSLVVDEILIGAGRAPNVEGLNLEAADVAYDTRNGVIVDDYLRTSNSRIYAAGDICSRYKFTHTADAAARIVIRNALFMGRSRYSDLVVPWCTYTDPEIAHVGIYPREAAEQGIDIETFQQTFDKVDRAIAEGDEEGFVKIHVRKGTDKILGATIVAPHAGEMISEITAAIVGDVGLGKLASVIHPYPTQAEAIKRCADAYNRTRLTPTVHALMKRWINWTN